MLEITLISVLFLFPVVDLFLNNKSENKIVEYIKTAVILWTLTGFLIFCFFQGALSVKHPFLFPADQWKGYFAIFMFIAFFVYLKYIIVSINKNKEVKLYILKSLENQNESIKEMLPESRKEFILFTLLLSVTAGICEELIFRWYLYSLLELQVNWIVGILGSSFVFGFWHLYLGWKHVITTAFIGILLCGIYLYFESIFVVMITHILMDVYQGIISYYARLESD